MTGGFRDRIRRLDDNLPVKNIVWLSDHFGWWWNLYLGIALLIAAPIVLVMSDHRADAVALAAFGSAGILTGLALRAGRNRRRQG